MNEAGHLHALMYGDLNSCGCGNPDEAYKLVRDLLSLMPLFESDHWEQAIRLIGTPGAVQLVMGALDAAGLTEHGTSMLGSWLTAKGSYMLAAMKQTEWETVDEAGYPHYPDDCSDACWTESEAVSRG